MSEGPAERVRWGEGGVLALASVFVLLLIWYPGRNMFLPLTLKLDAIVALFVLLLAVAVVVVPRMSRTLVTWLVSTGVGTLIAMVVLIPTILHIYLRHTLQPYQFVHDGTIQIEEAVKFLGQGVNPYRADYSATPVAQWGGGRIFRTTQDPEGIPNPTFGHLVYLPGHLLLSVAARWVTLPIFGFYDDRFLTLAAYLAVIALALRLGRSPTERLYAVVLLALNPLLAAFVVEGRNDVVLLVVLLGSALALQRSRTALSAALFGLALSIKLFAVFLLPAYAVVLLARSPGRNIRERLRSSLGRLAIVVTVSVLLVAPVALWDLPSFYDDVVRYPAGTAAVSYPVGGWGLGALLLDLGVIPGRTAYFPFRIFQLLGVSLALVLLLPRLLRQPTPSRFLFVGTVTLLLGTITARYFNDNHLGFILALFGAAWGLDRLERGRGAVSSAP